jgi:arylsulfatase
MAYSFGSAQAKSPHTVQYVEFQGNRGIYKDGWYALTLHRVPWESQPRSTFDQDKWELYNTVGDFSGAIDLAAKYPDKLKEMQAAFLTEAIKYNVLPLDDRGQERFNPAIAGRPDLLAGRTSLAVYEGMIGMKENAFINTKDRSYSVTGDLDVPQSGAAGVILAQGGIHSGWSLYVRDGIPKFAYNYLGDITTICSTEPLPAGRVTINYDFAYDGGKPGAGGTGTIFINGRKVASGRIERTIPYLFGVETADVGMDLYTPVTKDYKKRDNKFTGKISKVTVELKHMSTADEQSAKNAETEAVKFVVDQK